MHRDEEASTATVLQLWSAGCVKHDRFGLQGFDGERVHAGLQTLLKNNIRDQAHSNFPYELLLGGMMHFKLLLNIPM